MKNKKRKLLFHPTPCLYNIFMQDWKYLGKEFKLDLFKISTFYLGSYFYKPHSTLVNIIGVTNVHGPSP